MILDSDTLKKRLRYQGRQYATGQASRGGPTQNPHMLEQAADRIEALETQLLHCVSDYEYLQTVTKNKDGLHDWLRMRAEALKSKTPAKKEKHWAADIPAGDVFGVFGS